ncbi:PilZ domain-containing protein [Stratiformator vulcanicus]|uniref:PilZ domain protein n=1 Tax=Stratiformator vulcanicus TaxID=2527980 RepID=A0A517QY24_9PLAN|nr:PilZ domain-containing protein [Stratiformator vulcanicus]QDT36460.1 PilZ domain protein [Stratiformator vulcanicus]
MILNSTDRRSKDDRRAEPRPAQDVSIRFLAGDGTAGALCDARLADASTSGVRIASERPVENGTALLIEAHHGPQRLNLSAKVMWCREKDDWHLIGCRLNAPLTHRQAGLLRSIAEATAPDAS